MDLDAVRAGLPVLDRLAYLNAGTNGPLPRRTVEAMGATLARDLEQGRSSQGYFEAMLARRDEVRAGARPLPRGAGGDHRAHELHDGGVQRRPERPRASARATRSSPPTQSTRDSSAGLSPRERILKIVPVRDLPVAELAGTLDAAVTERTKLIALSHVSWLTGAVMPVESLVGRGIPLLVDGAQAAGAMPVAVADLGCDFYTVSAQKWLLGPDVTGALFVRPERVEELRMAMPSYGSWEFGDDYTYDPKAGAARFDPGWIAAASGVGLLESLAFAEEAGEERYTHAADMAAHLMHMLEGLGCEVVTEPGQATLVTWKAAGDSKEVVERLADAGVVIRDLPGLGWLRASCGFWTNHDDLERLVGAL